MKMVTFLLVAGLLVAPGYARAEETVKENVKAAGNTVVRGAKKAKNRVKEALCTDSDLECKAKKAGNRIGEGAEKFGDKIEEKTN